MSGLSASRWLRVAAVGLALALLVWLLVVLKPVLTPFAAAFALAYFLNPVANVMERFFERDIARSRLRGLVAPRAAAVTVLVAIVLLVVLAVVLVVVPAVYQQGADAAAKLPDYARTLRGKVEPLVERLNLRYPEQAERLRHEAQEAIRSNLPTLLSPVTRAVRAAFSSLLGFVLALLNLVVVPVFVVYLLFDMNRITAGVRELVPHRYRPYVYSRTGEVTRLLSAFVRGQITVCLILGSFYALGLSLSGVPLGLLVGFVIGFFNLVPFMSTVLGLPLALLLSWVDDQSLARLAVVLALFAVGQFVEGNFITPRVVGRSLGLHAVVIMLAVLVGGTLLGFMGMLLAVPVTAALSVFWADLRQLYLASAFYRGPTPAG